MKKLLLLLGLLALAGTAAQADERDTVKRSAEILREFRSMPERQVPRAVLRDARGLAIMRVVKVGFVFSGKGGEGVVIARTGNGGQDRHSLEQAARVGVCKWGRRSPISSSF
jgi:lipid-binding SYLF domain-containing protein